MPALVIIEGLTMYLSEADVRRIFDVIAARLPKAEVFVETMNPAVAKRFKERSIEGSHAKFTWGVKDGRTLAALLPGFRFVEEHSLTEGMAVFAPIYKLLDKLPAVRNISNKIIVLETIHSYVEQKARRQKKLFLRLMCIPGLYKKVPGIFSEQTPKLFGVTAGFAARDIQTTGGVWRIDMTKCRITTPACTTAVRSCATASATATILRMTACTPSSTGTAQRRWAAGATAAISA